MRTIGFTAEDIPSSPPLFAIGPYRLDSSITGLVGLVEFSPAEYEFIKLSPDEKIFKAPGVEFLNTKWRVTLRCNRNTLYEIALFFESDDSSEAEAVASRARMFVSEKLGDAGRTRSDMTTWTREQNGGINIYERGKCLVVVVTWSGFEHWMVKRKLRNAGMQIKERLGDDKVAVCAYFSPEDERQVLLAIQMAQVR